MDDEKYFERIQRQTKNEYIVKQYPVILPCVDLSFTPLIKVPDGQLLFDINSEKVFIKYENKFIEIQND